MRIIILSILALNIQKMKLLQGMPGVDEIIVCGTTDEVKEAVQQPSTLKTIVLADGNCALDAIFDLKDEIVAKNTFMFVADDTVRPTIMHAVKDHGIGYVIYPIEDVDFKKFINCK